MKDFLKAAAQTVGLTSLMVLLLSLTVFYFLPFAAAAVDYILALGTPALDFAR